MALKHRRPVFDDDMFTIVNDMLELLSPDERRRAWGFMLRRFLQFATNMAIEYTDQGQSDLCLASVDDFRQPLVEKLGRLMLGQARAYHRTHDKQEKHRG